ncbi:MAG: S1 family peptidase [Gemmatimonadaceae bacterium]|nr:S1 family peptidase [Gemmatimonadaceae bacterium]
MAAAERERAQRGDRARGVEDEYLDVEAAASGFAGLYADANDTIHVRVRGGADVDRVKRVLATKAPSLRLPALLRNRLADGRGVVFGHAEFSMSELVAATKLTSTVATGMEVLGVDADERANRVFLQLGPSGDSTAIRERFVRLGVPASALVFGHQSGYVSLQSLRSWQRPTGGGLQTMNQNGNNGRCTLGWNVTTLFHNETGFLTAAHCAPGGAGSGPGQVGLPVYQPNLGEPT